MNKWIEASEQLPEPGQEIDAVILYLGKESVVEGKAMVGNPGAVIFSFYRDEVADTIIRWMPRNTDKEHFGVE